MRRRCAIVMLLAAFTTPLFAQDPGAEPWKQLCEQGLELMYQYDYEPAIAAFEQARRLAPSEPAIHWRLSQALWLQIKRDLENERAAKNDDDLHFKTDQPGPHAHYQYFLSVLEEGSRLASERLKKNPGDAEARFLLGAFAGMQSAYLADIFGKAKDAREPMEEMRAALEPLRQEWIITATGNSRAAISAPVANALVYLGGTNIALWHVAKTRFFARLAFKVFGISYDGDEGLMQLQFAAAAGLHDGQFALLEGLMKVSEAQKWQKETTEGALRLARWLRDRYPRNPTLWYKEKLLLIKLRRYEEAAAVLAGALEQFRGDPRPLSGILRKLNPPVKNR